MVSVDVVAPNATLLCISENGYGKKTSFEEYRNQSRGGKGIITMKTSDRNGAVVGAHSVRDNDAMMIMTQKGQMIRIGVHDIRTISRNTQGVRIINLDEGDIVVSATSVEPDDDAVVTEETGPAIPVPTMPNPDNL